MPHDVRVLIVARDEAVAAPLSRGLDTLGWRTITVRGANAAQIALEDLPIEAALVVTDGLDEAQGLAARLRAQRAPRPFPVIGVRTGEAALSEHGFDLTLAAACHPSQVALRLEQLVRAVAAEEEFILRQRTFADHGSGLSAPAADASPYRVLTVGEPTPNFLALSHALRARGAEVTAAFTAYTAFDYLHERAFDAVALWAGETQAEALSIAAGMRRNSRLYHLPTLLYLRSRSEIDPASAYRRGLTDIATAETPPEETARRIAALARGYRREVAIRQALEQARGVGLTDPSTGLFTPELFAAHLARLTESVRARGRPLSPGGAAHRRPARDAARARRRLAGAGGAPDRLHDRPLGPRRGHRRPDRRGNLRPRPARRRRRGGAERGGADRRGHRLHRFPGRARPAPLQGHFEVGAAELQLGETAGHALERAAALSARRKAS